MRAGVKSMRRNVPAYRAGEGRVKDEILGMTSPQPAERYGGEGSEGCFRENRFLLGFHHCAMPAILLLRPYGVRRVWVRVAPGVVAGLLRPGLTVPLPLRGSLGRYLNRCKVRINLYGGVLEWA